MYGWRGGEFIVYGLQFIVYNLRDYGKYGNNGKHGNCYFFFLTQITRIAQIFCVKTKTTKTLTLVYDGLVVLTRFNVYIFP